MKRLIMLLIGLTCLGLASCSINNPFGGAYTYKVTSIQTVPATVYVGDEVRLYESHEGHVDGPCIDLSPFSARWRVSRGYFITPPYNRREHWTDIEFQPHIEKLQEVAVYGPPVWLAPEEPGSVTITCTFWGSAPSSSKLKPLTVAIDVLPRP